MTNFLSQSPKYKFREHYKTHLNNIILTYIQLLNILTDVRYSTLPIKKRCAKATTPEKYKL
jgi:hypothetical protein